MATGVAEPLPPSSTPHTYSYPPIIFILTVVLLLFFFAGFFSIYFCRCFMENLLCTWHFRRSTPPGVAVVSTVANGLDPSIVKSFPSFTYSTVKDYTKERYGVECAICLVEFRSSDVLRLITACCHVFHQECIDLWLDSHTTCPVCRRNLNSPVQSPVKSPHQPSSNMVGNNGVDCVSNGVVQLQDSCSITIKDEDHEEVEDKENGKEGANTDNDLALNEREKFTRSHSTGHSIRKRGGGDDGEDRFKLILPENVKSRIMSGHNSSKSWTSFGEYKAKNKINGCDAEASGVATGYDVV